MLQKIKANYFVRILFFHIDDGKTLKIARYNKSLQSQLYLNILNYKIFSGRYLVLDGGKGKEFSSFNDQLMFEGEYKDGKRNGKGKEFYKDLSLSFEGEYKDGKRNGKGKEYDFFNKFSFEGEYKNGKKWNGKAYDIDNNILYELKNGNGHVKEYFFSKLEFEG